MLNSLIGIALKLVIGNYKFRVIIIDFLMIQYILRSTSYTQDIYIHTANL
jgi:hypothetical protein